ncbi:methionine adenosyltransferase [Porphyromonadaceae bacterium KH3CP3RA]|nr:methionine adenosyltransferase [Porphyromonadaceae bacterium KH3CP3RA]
MLKRFTAFSFLFIASVLLIFISLRMNYFFTSESVSEGHPDKVADQISDALLDEFLAYDRDSKVACETLVTTGQVVLAGEVKSNTYVDVAEVAREVIAGIGYTKSEYRFEALSCGVFSSIHEQSDDINRGVDQKADPMDQGAGDQGMMFGYATDETENYMPLPIDLSHALLQELANIRKNEPELMPYLRPDAKSQVTIEYNEEGVPQRIDTIVISTQHDEFEKPKNNTKEAALEADRRMQSRIRSDIKSILIPRVQAQYRKRKDVHKLFDGDITYHVNPTGKFVIGGPHGDTGLTGRKIIVDTYGGKAPHGGGAFSGKDPSKVDRSAAYAVRHIAKNMVAAGVAQEMLIQVSYAIGVAEPMNIYVNTFGKSNVSLSDAEIAKKIGMLFDLRPKAIEQRLKLRNPIYRETASYGHMGREPKVVKKVFNSRYMPKPVRVEVELFTWEKLDYVDKIKKEFGL